MAKRLMTKSGAVIECVCDCSLCHDWRRTVDHCSACALGRYRDDPNRTTLLVEDPVVRRDGTNPDRYGKVVRLYKPKSGARGRNVLVLFDDGQVDGIADSFLERVR